jgi:hypothetical protein
MDVYKDISIICRVMLARLVQLTRSLYPAAGTVTEDDDSSMGRCVTPHASLAKSVVQPPLYD